MSETTIKTVGSVLVPRDDHGKVISVVCRSGPPLVGVAK